MKPNALLFLCSFHLFSGSVLFAQTQGNDRFQGRSMVVDGGIMANQLKKGLTMVSVEDAEGSPYWIEDYENAAIYVHGVAKTKANVRYNGYADYLEIMEGGKVSELMRRDYIEVELQGKRVRFLEYKDGDNITEGYLVQMTEGKLSFFMKPEKIYKAARKARSSYDKDIPASFIDRYSYYLKKGDGPIEKVRVNNRLLKDLFGSDHGKAMDYAKKQNLNGKEPEDLAKIIDWYNSL